MARTQPILRIEKGSVLDGLGWTDADFLAAKVALIGVRLQHNLPLTPQQACDWDNIPDNVKQA